MDQDQKLKEIEAEINRFTNRLNILEQKGRNLGTMRGVIFLSGLLIFFISFFYLEILPVFLIAALFLTASGILAKFHNEIERGIKKHKIWIGIKSANTARINIDWEKLPFPKIEEKRLSHPFEFDLNISGEHSLHRLIDSSVTKEGSIKLLEWLTAKVPDKDTIIWRQKIVKELMPLTKFRNKLLLNSSLVAKKELYGERLTKWLNQGSNIKPIKKILFSLYIVVPINLIFIALAAFGILTTLWIFSASLLLLIHYFNLKYTKDLFDRSLTLSEDIGKFYEIFKFLEEYPYGKNSYLKEYCSSFINKEKSPSAYFKKIDRIILFVSFQKNPLTKLLLNILFPWIFYNAYHLEQIKIELSEQLPRWLNTWYNLEALLSLANFAYLNPSYCFPQIQNNITPAVEAEEIAHPLIPFKKNISNNFYINTIGLINLITGSNMSGKSTFLKTMGLNLALAFAGSVVNARKFNVSLFRLFTSINITDSVVDGISYFYAEVKRLKELIEELNKVNDIPLFFLIDEIFKGTNNKERLIGSRSYIKALAGRNGTGLISTHDLELIKLENEIAGIINYHFKEEIVKDKMIFNYKIIQGPSPTTNALQIMKLEGLPID